MQGIYASSLPLTDIVRPSLVGEVLRTRFGEVELFRLVLLLAATVPVLLGIRGKIDPGQGADWHWVNLRLCPRLALLATPGLAGHACYRSTRCSGWASILAPCVGLGLDGRLALSQRSSCPARSGPTCLLTRGR